MDDIMFLIFYYVWGMKDKNWILEIDFENDLEVI